MRKNYLLLLSALLCFITVYSQNTISRKNYFTLGSEYSCKYIYAIDNNTVYNSGNDAVWDFSNTVTLSDTDRVIAVAPPETPFFYYYNNTQLCLHTVNGYISPEQDMYSYFQSSDQEIAFAGEWADNGTWEYYYHQFEDPEKYYAFPFSLGDMFTDDYRSMGYDMSGSGWHTSWGTRNVTADGYGILVMPDNIYPHCLRLKSTVNYSDTSSVFGLHQGMFCEYTWFDLEKNGPVLEVSLSNNLYLNRGRYFYNNPPVSASSMAYDMSVTLSPNPVIDKLNVQFKSSPSGKIDLIIFNETGMPVLTSEYTAAASIELSVEALPSGVYFLKIINDKGTFVKKFVKY